MEIELETIRNLIERPGESLSVEVKRWIDPDDIEGIGKIVRTVLALRNHGGGYMGKGSVHEFRNFSCVLGRNKKIILRYGQEASY